MHRLSLSAALCVLAASSAQAQGFTGGTLTVETFAFLDDLDLGYTTYSGGLEYDAGFGLSVAADLSSFGFRTFDSDATNATLHGIYSLGGGTAVGLFIGRDSMNSRDLDIYGIEGTTQLMGGRLEGFVGGLDGDGDDAVMAGIDGDYMLTPVIAATATIGFAEIDGDRLLRGSVGGEFKIDRGPVLYAQIGGINADDDPARDNEAFVGIGARIDFGPGAGTTFGSRSLFDVVPGL